MFVVWCVTAPATARRSLLGNGNNVDNAVVYRSTTSVSFWRETIRRRRRRSRRRRHTLAHHASDAANERRDTKGLPHITSTSLAHPPISHGYVCGRVFGSMRRCAACNDVWLVKATCLPPKMTYSTRTELSSACYFVIFAAAMCCDNNQRNQLQNAVLFHAEDNGHTLYI